VNTTLSHISKSILKRSLNLFSDHALTLIHLLLFGKIINFPVYLSYAGIGKPGRVVKLTHVFSEFLSFGIFWLALLSKLLITL